MLKTFWKFITSRKAIICLAVAAVLVLIWFVGPLVSVAGITFLAGEAVRLWTMLSIVAIWGAFNLVVTRKAVDAPAPQIVPANRDRAPSSTVGGPAEAIMDALARLRRLHGRWKAPYCLPWYVVLGDSGAGKTRALAASGLDFLPSRHADALSGDLDECACYIAGEAVLVDIKGTVISSSGQRRQASSTWQALIRTLRLRRRFQPLDGVIVVVDVVALATSPVDKQAEQARDIRGSLLALSHQLGVKVPVYILFTQLDRLRGFPEFSASLRREEREQTLGATFSPAVADPAAEFGAIMDRIGARLAARVQKAVLRASSLPRRTTLFQFPAQFALLQAPALNFLSAVFARTALNDDLMPRGAFFAAAGGDGSEEDLLGPVLARLVDTSPRPAIADLRSGGDNALLLRPLRDFMFPEAWMAGRSRPIQRRRAAVLAAALMVFGLMAWSAGSATLSLWSDQRAAMRILAESVAGLDYGFSVMTPPRRFEDTLPILDGLASLHAGATPADREAWRLLVPSAIGEVAAESYDNALETILAPLVMARLEAGLKTTDANAADTYDTLKAALLFAGEAPFELAPMESWFSRALGETVADTNTRERLLSHFRALAQMQRKRPLNADLISAARDRASQTPLAARAYERFMFSAEVEALRGWVPGDAAGAPASRVLTRVSGASLWRPLPGVFSRSGFHNTFLPLSRRFAEDQAAEGWVLGLPDDIAARQQRAAAIRRDMLTLYLDDFILTWDALLADIEIIPFSTISQGADELNVLTGPESPLRRLLEGVSAETDLTPPPPPKPGSALDPAAALEAARVQAQQTMDRATGFPDLPGKPVNVHFTELHRFTAHKEGAPSQLDDVITQMRPLYSYLNRMSVAGQPSDTLASLATQFAQGGDSSPLLQVKALANNAPAPVARLVEGVALYGAAAATDDAHGFLSAAWRQTAGALCQATLTDRYPHAPATAEDIPAADFIALLGPGGAVDKFFDEHLKAFVDRNQHPWKLRRLGAASLDLEPASLAFFEKAAAIRDSWFIPGQQTLRLSFSLAPDLVDAKVRQLTYRIDDQVMTYRHGPVQETTFTLAGGKETHVAALSIAPPLPNTSGLVEKGPWAVLRLLERAKIEPFGADRFRLRYKLGEVEMSFWLRTPSHNTPLDAAAIQALSCPSDL